MKKYTLLSAIFISAFVLLGFNVSSADAYYDAGCTGAGPYSVLSGMVCDNSQYSQYSQYGQQYVQPTYNPTNYAYTQELAIGSRGQDVITLQQNLRDRGYSLGRADGIFGSATRRAVINYQRDSGLPVTGVAEVQTLTSLNIVPGSFPIPYTSPTCPVVIVNGIATSSCGGYGGYTVPTISNVSGPQTLAVNQTGTWSVSAYDSNGGSLSYSVYWGDEVYGLYANAYPTAMQLQQSATFSHVYSRTGTYTPKFTVTNIGGQSANTSLSVVVGSGTINSGLNIIQTSLPNATMGTTYSATIQAAGGTGSYYWSVSSGSLPPGLYLAQAQCFAYPCQAPATISGTPTVSSGTYTFQVTLSDGISRAYQSFTINMYGGVTQVPNISYLSPTSGSRGSQVTIYGSGFGYSSCTAYSCGNVASQPVTVNFGGNVIQNVYSYNGTSLTFTVPTYTSPACLYSYPACAIPQTVITPGTYAVSVTNAYGISNAVNFIVIY